MITPDFSDSDPDIGLDILDPDEPDCPTCQEAGYHADDCARVGTCGQYPTAAGAWVPDHALHRMPDPPAPPEVATPEELPALTAWWDRWRQHLRTEHRLDWP